MAVTRSELEHAFSVNRVRPDAYDLSGNGTEVYVLSETDEIWSVFYAERGQKNGLRKFNSESDACHYLLSWVLADPTTRLGETR